MEEIKEESYGDYSQSKRNNYENKTEKEDKMKYTVSINQNYSKL